MLPLGCTYTECEGKPLTIRARAHQSLSAPADGNAVDVIVEHNEDIGRSGFSGLLAELDDPARAKTTESPEVWAPVAVSHGSKNADRARAVDVFCAWLRDEREQLAS